MNYINWLEMIKGDNLKNKVIERLKSMTIISIVVKNGVNEFDDSIPYTKKYKFVRIPVINGTNPTINTIVYPNDNIVEFLIKFDEDDFYKVLATLPIGKCSTIDDIINGIVDYIEGYNKFTVSNAIAYFKNYRKKRKEKNNATN